MSTSRNTGTNHKGKTVQTFNFVTFFVYISSQSWDIHRTPSTIITNIWASFLQFCYSGFAGCPWDTEQVAASLPPQISYPCWALQSNTERNLPSTFSVFFTHIFSCSLRITLFFLWSRKLHRSHSIQLVRIFNNIQTFSNHIYIPVSFLVRIKRSTIQLLFKHFSFLSH